MHGLQKFHFNRIKDEDGNTKLQYAGREDSYIITEAGRDARGYPVYHHQVDDSVQEFIITRTIRNPLPGDNLTVTKKYTSLREAFDAPDSDFEPSQEALESNLIQRAIDITPIGGMGAAKNVGNVFKFRSAVKQNPRLLKVAQKIFDGNKSLRDESNALINAMLKGNLNPGKGTKVLGNGISYARGGVGARVYFRVVDGTLEVVGYSNKHKGTQNAVINILKDIY